MDEAKKCVSFSMHWSNGNEHAKNVRETRIEKLLIQLESNVKANNAKSHGWQRTEIDSH